MLAEQWQSSLCQRVVVEMMAYGVKCSLTVHRLGVTDTRQKLTSMSLPKGQHVTSRLERVLCVGRSAETSEAPVSWAEEVLGSEHLSERVRSFSEKPTT